MDTQEISATQGRGWDEPMAPSLSVLLFGDTTLQQGQTSQILTLCFSIRLASPGRVKSGDRF